MVKLDEILDYFLVSSYINCIISVSDIKMTN